MDVNSQCAFDDLASQVVAVLLTVVFGCVGYLVAEFWFGPIRRYLDLRRRVTSDLVYYANALSPLPSSQADNRVTERCGFNRRLAADLQAASSELPRLYLKWLSRTGRDPARAATELLGLSNTLALEEAKGRIAEIQARLGLGYIVVSRQDSERLRSNQ